MFQLAASIYYSGFLCESESDVVDTSGGFYSNYVIDNIKDWPTTITDSYDKANEVMVKGLIKKITVSQRAALIKALGQDPDYTLEEFKRDWLPTEKTKSY